MQPYRTIDEVELAGDVAETESITGPLNEYGSFSATHIEPGKYQLTIESQPEVYTILDLSIRLGEEQL